MVRAQRCIKRTGYRTAAQHCCQFFLLWPLALFLYYSPVAQKAFSPLTTIIKRDISQTQTANKVNYYSLCYECLGWNLWCHPDVKSEQTCKLKNIFSCIKQIYIQLNMCYFWVRYPLKIWYSFISLMMEKCIVLQQQSGYWK